MGYLNLILKGEKTMDIIITHVDPDGMVSAILLMKYVTPDARVKFTNGKKLIEKLDEIISMETKPDNIYITDLPLVAEKRLEVLKALEKLHSQGVKIHVIDHHFGWNHADVDSSIFATFHVDTSKTTAAKPVYDIFGPATKGYEIWLAVLSKKDKSADDEISDCFALLVALMHNYKNREAVLSDCAKDEPIRQKYRKLIDWYFNTHIPYLKSIAADAVVFITTGGKRIGSIDLRQVGGFVNVNQHVIDQFKVDLVVTILSDAILVGGRHIDEVDLSQLPVPVSSARGTYTIVGHRSPIRIQWKDIDADIAVQEISDWLIEVL